MDWSGILDLVGNNIGMDQLILGMGVRLSWLRIYPVALALRPKALAVSS
jgi:hypothetical protein